MDNPDNQVPAPIVEAIKKVLNLIQAPALIGGTLVMFACASIWGFITYTTGYELGMVSVGLSIAVGLVVKRFDRGNPLLCSLIGGVLTLAGCVLGNLCFFGGYIGRETGIGPIAVLNKIISDPAVVLPWVLAGYGALDLVCYLLAVYLGFRLAYSRAVRKVQLPE